MIIVQYLTIIYIHIYIYKYIYIYIFDKNTHPRSGDKQDQQTYLVHFADNQTGNYDKECSNHHPSLSTLRSKGLSLSKMKW